MNYETALGYVENFVKDLDREVFENGNKPLECLDLRVWEKVLGALKDQPPGYEVGYEVGYDKARREYEKV